ncbi:MAG: sigma-70 family RNA polymerase sigma factor [Alphaproteobacteria bacterium]
MAQRDKDNVKWLIAREIPHLRRYARALVKDHSLADDLVQDCLERAIRKRHLWKRHGRIRSWLYRILYNVFLNQRPQRMRILRQASIESLQTTPSVPPPQDQQMAYRDISDAMGMLPSEQRAAIALTAVEGLSYDEAAQALDIPIGTLRSRVARGRDRLRVLYVQPENPIRLRRVK